MVRGAGVDEAGQIRLQLVIALRLGRLGEACPDPATDRGDVGPDARGKHRTDEGLALAPVLEDRRVLCQPGEKSDALACDRAPGPDLLQFRKFASAGCVRGDVGSDRLGDGRVGQACKDAGRRIPGGRTGPGADQRREVRLHTIESVRPAADRLGACRQLLGLQVQGLDAGQARDALPHARHGLLAVAHRPGIRRDVAFVQILHHADQFALPADRQHRSALRSAAIQEEGGQLLPLEVVFVVGDADLLGDPGRNVAPTGIASVVDRPVGLQDGPGLDGVALEATDVAKDAPPFETDLDDGLLGAAPIPHEPLPAFAVEDGPQRAVHDALAQIVVAADGGDARAEVQHGIDVGLDVAHVDVAHSGLVVLPDVTPGIVLDPNTLVGIRDPSTRASNTPSGR